MSLEEALENAFLRLMTEDIGNQGALAFRNKIDTETATHLARQLTRVALAVFHEYDRLEGRDDV